MNKTILTKDDVSFLRAARVYPAMPSAIERYRLRQIDRMTARMFPVEARHIDKFFTFRDAEQPRRGYAGWNLLDRTTNKSYIGILDLVLSCQLSDGINSPRDYLWGSVLHEIAHIAHGKHQGDFLLKLEDMIYRYNKMTEREIEITGWDVEYALSQTAKPPLG